MTHGDDVAQSPGLTEPKWGRPARCWRHFNFRFANVSRRVGAWGYPMPKVGGGRVGWLIGHVYGRLARVW
jgi:hypothetical protein